MTNAKKIVGIVIIVIGSIFLVSSNIVGYLFALQLPGLGGFVFILPTIIGVVIIVIGLNLLLTSIKRKANAKKIIGRIIGIILLSIGLMIIIWGSLYWWGGVYPTRGWWVLPLYAFIFGVMLSLIGVCILIPSRKKNSKSPDK